MQDSFDKFDERMLAYIRGFEDQNGTPPLKRSIAAAMFSRAYPDNPQYQAVEFAANRLMDSGQLGSSGITERPWSTHVLPRVKPPKAIDYGAPEGIAVFVRKVGERYQIMGRVPQEILGEER